MKNVMIVFGVFMILVSTMIVGCGKSEGEGDEKKAGEKKEIEKKVKFGESFTFWTFDEQGEKKTQLSVSFERFSLNKQHPAQRYFTGRNPTGLAWVYEPILASRGKKYFTVYLAVENLGPRASGLRADVEFKTDKGYFYNLDRYELVSALEWENSFLKRIGSLGPGEKGWLTLYDEISNEIHPIELFGILETIEYFSKNREEMLGVRFRLSLPRDKKPASSDNKVLKISILGKYIVDRETATIFLERDGVIVDSLCGKCLELKNDGTFSLSGSFASETPNAKWRSVRIIRFNFPKNEKAEQSLRMEFLEGEIEEDTILVADKSNPNVSWVKQIVRGDDSPWIGQKDSRVIKVTDQKDNIWSEYTHKDVPFSLEPKKDGIFAMSVKGRWEIGSNVITLHDPSGEEKPLEAKLKGDSLECPFSGNSMFKQKKAKVIKKTKRGTFWSQYTSVDESFSLEFKKNNLFNFAVNGTWMTRPGIICCVGDLRWKAEIKNNTLIDKDGESWAKE